MDPLCSYIASRKSFNRHDPNLITGLFRAVDSIIVRMTKDETQASLHAMEKKIKALEHVKRDLTNPTRVGGFDCARSDLIDRIEFFKAVTSRLAV